MYRKYFKRPLDFIMALVGLVVLSPVLLGVAILVRIKLGSPVLFKQERIGRDEKPFVMYKFRTMSNKRNEKGELLPDTERLTKFGQMLRTLSLDELPELWNVMMGDMSIIGPRPLPTDYLPHYTEEERRRHSVRGGLTGLAQVRGRNSLSWEERFKYDLEYANSITFLGDVDVFISSVRKVIKHDDIGIRGQSSPPDFHIYRQNDTQELI
jgi:undecaprenyl phosphate N,N'-diacetylbacillosamine 1-phosphate transferase